MKKVFKILLWVFVAAIVLGTFYFLYKNSQPKEEHYAIVTPQITDIQRTTVLNGKIEPRDEIQIKPQISGIISSIEVEAGDFVKEGDVIARIKVIPEASQLSSAQSRIDAAQLEVNDARLKYARSKDLYNKKVISREEYETAELTLNKAEKELEYAKDSYRIVKEGVSQFNAKESNTLVRATITGLVLDVPVKVGSSVIQANTMNDGTTVATIADMTNLIFKGNVDETEVGLLKPGMKMDITIGAVTDLKPQAVLEYISPKGTENNGANTFEIKAALTVDDPSQLRSGYSANAAIILSEANDVLALPESVVTFEKDSTFVYVMTDSLPQQKFEKRAVTTGLSDGINVEIKKGVDKKTTVRAEKIEMQ